MPKVIGTAPYQVPTNADLGTMAFQDASAISVDLLQVDNLRLDGNVLSSTDTNGNITLTPNGTGIVSVSSNMTVAGNLTVNGTTTTTNSTSVTIDDPIFTLGGDTAPGADDNKDRGIEFRWHNGSAAKLGFFGYDDSAAEFTFIPDATNSSEVFSGNPGNVRFGGGTFEGSVTLGDASADTITINGTATFANVNPTLTAGTANGVAYLNGSKVLTTGSALTYNGSTTLSVGTAGGGYFISNYDSQIVAGGDAAGYYFAFGNGNGTAVPMYYGANVTSHIFRVSNSEQMRLTSTGLGIRATPDVSLHVYSSAAQAIKFTQAAGATRVLLGNQDSGGANAPAIIASANTTIQFGIGNSWSGDGGTFSPKFTFDANAKLGIDTTTPATKLDIANAQGDGIQFRYDSTTGYRAWVRPYWNSSSDSRIDFAINRTSGATPDVIMSVGYNTNVGVGTTTPSARLETVATTPSTDIALSVKSNTRFVSPDGTKTMSMRMLDSDVLTFSGGAGQLFSISDSMTGTIFAVNDVSGMPSIEVFDSGKVQIAELTGNVLIGTSVDTGFKLRVAGTSHITQLGVGSANNTNFDFYNNGTSYFNGAVTIDDNLTMSGGYIRMGSFGASVVNTGEAWLGRASDRSAGTMTVQLGSDAARVFEVVDKDWTTVIFNVGMNALQYKGNAIWHAGNDGSTSGLDADLLDGQHGSYYLNTSTSFGGDVSGTYNAIIVADNSHNHTSLTGVTSIAFASEATDAASISTSVSGSATYFDFNLSDDNNNDWWRWRFTPNGSTVYDAMTLKPSANGVADLTIAGTVIATTGSLTSLNINGGTLNGTNDATLYVTATNDADWGIRVNKFNGSSTDYGFKVEIGSSGTYGIAVYGSGSEKFRVDGSGNTHIATTGALYFGSATRQMVNLYGTSYGIGVQSATAYFRSDGRFSWHRGGSHNDGENNPGGGTVAMTLDSSSNLIVTGSLFATTKSFIIDHPTKPGKKLRYGSLEGPENGVYVRGRLKDGNVIELPDYWTKLVDPDSITVQLTPIGKYQKLYVEDVRDNKVYVASDSMFGSINCFYYVLAERADVDKLEVECD